MDSLASILKTLGHPDRLRILAILSHGDFTVSEITKVMGLSQPRVTQYINTLEAVGILERLKEGSWVFSRLRRQNAKNWAIVSAVLSQLPDDDAVLMADFRRLGEIKTARAEAANAFFAQAANDQDQLGIEYLPREDIDAELRSLLGDGPHELLVDLGTGSGRVLTVLADLFGRGIGIDNSRDMLGVARHSLNKSELTHMRVRQGDLNNTGLVGSDASVVTLHQVLHYLERPAEAIAESARLLSDHGQLIIIDFDSHDFDDFRDRFAHRHLGFSDNTIATYFKSCGLTLSQTRTVETRESYPNVKLWCGIKAASMKDVS
ncbi:MAG: metalloregulator ArsR/SmtB family transcription factor [Maricaulaceae bacterium]